MFTVECTIEGLGVKLPDVCPCELLTSGSAFCAAHIQVALEKGCPPSVKGFLKLCGPAKETGSVVYFCFSDVLVSQLLFIYHFLGLYSVIFVLLMCIMCYPLQLSLFVHVLLSRSFLHAFVYKSVFSFIVVLCWFVSCIKYSFKILSVVYSYYRYSGYTCLD